MATITYLTTVQFGFGELKTIAPGLADLKIARPLIVADRGLATDLIDRLRAASPLMRQGPLGRKSSRGTVASASSRRFEEIRSRFAILST